ncbi:MAG TPA: DEAD/DEAH box helicase [Opitutaceae bacterium]|nr:DEAD/DEAH box helicase [Opitutaceae bacterium]
MLRLFLPPNLAAAAARDAIALRVEIDPAGEPPPAILPALALLQRWCATPVPPRFIQLTRQQLRELVTALAGQPAFLWVNAPTAPLPWEGTALSGVSEHLTAVAANVGASLADARAPTRGAPTPRKTKTLDLPAAPPLQVDGTEHYLALTLPSREHPTYAAALELVKGNGFILEPSNRRWWLRDRHKTLNFLAAHGDRLRGMFGADFTANFEKNTAHLRPAEIAAEIGEAGDGFAVTLGLRAGSADDTQFRAAAAGNRSYLEADGKIFLLDAARLQRLAEAQRALSGQPGAGSAARRTHRIGAARVAEAQEILEELSPGFQPPATWRARTEALRNLSALQPAPLSAAFDRQLRPYQRVGVAWLWHLWRHQLGGILADEMGLGKTLQALGLLSAVAGEGGGSREAGVESPEATTETSRTARTPALDSRLSVLDPRRASLVVCPASLLENWRREAAHFAPQLRVFVHHGENRLGSAADFTAVDLVITSYGTLTRDQELFGGVAFAAVVADEAQHIKNRRSQNAAALRALRARGRFLLTGTPVENSLDDLRSLFEFLLPGYLDRIPEGTRGDERAWFDARLRAKVAPYLLRRTKQAVAPELPPKLEQVIWCELGPAQAALYRAMQERTERELLDLEAGGAGEAKLRFAALTQLLRLRQICCDPRLLPENPNSKTQNPKFEESDSAKLEAFRELLAEIVDDGHRVLVFSQFTSLLDLLQADLDGQGLASCRLDGAMTARARQAEVDRFQSSPEIPVFLLSLKAGGTGLNLTGADTVVHFDPWWNPAAEAQATDRAHRIGQARVVTSYKLIAAGTVEEKVLALQDTKRALLQDVFEASDELSAKISLDDLRALLK